MDALAQMHWSDDKVMKWNKSLRRGNVGCRSFETVCRSVLLLGQGLHAPFRMVTSSGLNENRKATI